MTGFGRGGAPLGNARLEVEIRSLNHRFLEIRPRMPRPIADLAMEVEQLARGRLRRGRVEVLVTLEGGGGSRVALDRELARDAFRALAELRDELAPGEPIPLALLGTVPDLFAPSHGAERTAASEALRIAFHEAADRLDEMRSAEGAALSKDIEQHLASIRRFVDDLRRRAPEVISAQRLRLQERVSRLLGEGAPPLDEARLGQGIAVLADRSDVAEEIARIESHCDQIAHLSALPNDVGRRLDFLLQELAREANTIGAKSQNAGITQVVVDLKVEIERMREQAQNVE